MLVRVITSSVDNTSSFVCEDEDNVVSVLF